MNSIFEITGSTQKHNTLDSDYKAEVVALNLMKYHADVDQVFLKRLGSNNRSFNKDVESISSQVRELGELIISIASFREGMYDYLPEGLFHRPSLGNYKSRVEDVIAQIQRQKEIEASARNFFQPFELECFFLELNALAKENEFEITDRSELFLNAMKELWPLLDALDKDTAKVFIYLLPFFHAVKGSKEWFEKCLMAFLQVPVKITFVPNKVSDIKAASDAVSLSSFRLGVSMVLAGEHMDGERNWAVHYGPIPYGGIARYVPHSDLRKLLKILYGYCLPATVEVEEHFLADKDSHSFLLDRHQDANRLGYSTFL
ncbi:MAG TPA: type VI secretion system baseplate subunit TssG [Flavobacterium sp.]|nr:type VI secretion system baseplate subunit TssG [Flavobacterium sp.]